jgi:mannose-6-phosphate isomerase
MKFTGISEEWAYFEYGSQEETSLGSKEQRASNRRMPPKKRSTPVTSFQERRRDETIPAILQELLHTWQSSVPFGYFLVFFMNLPSPISFEPLAMERVWGGRRFETLLGKNLPPGVTVGELWEMVDRPEAQSVVRQGPFQGKTLHELWSSHREEVFGAAHRKNHSSRFPLLIKLLDACDRLSVQVHPPTPKSGNIGAEALEGEPKTECWYFLHAAEGSCVYAGLKKGVTRQSFEQALQNGTIEQTLHVAAAKTGESIFIPSGRCHAIGKGLVIVEVQQNSDTTYRVFDWNRKGLDGKPRDLHIPESLASIDFGDFEPTLTPAGNPVIADCPYFLVQKKDLPSPLDVAMEGDFSIITCITGEVTCGESILKPGGFLLIPACMREAILTPSTTGTTILVTRLPSQE